MSSTMPTVSSHTSLLFLYRGESSLCESMSHLTRLLKPLCCTHFRERGRGDLALTLPDLSFSDEDVGAECGEQLIRLCRFGKPRAGPQDLLWQPALPSWTHPHVSVYLEAYLDDGRICDVVRNC